MRRRTGDGPDLACDTARIRFLSAQISELNPEVLALVKSHPAGQLFWLSPAAARSSRPSFWSVGPTEDASAAFTDPKTDVA